MIWTDLSIRFDCVPVYSTFHQNGESIELYRCIYKIGKTNKTRWSLLWEKPEISCKTMDKISFLSKLGFC